MIRYVLAVILVAVSASATGEPRLTPSAGVSNVFFRPVYSPEQGLVLTVQNYTKLPRHIDAAEVAIGPPNLRGGCRVTLPATNLGPAERITITVATARTVSECGGAQATALRSLPRLEALAMAPRAASSSAPLVTLAATVNGVRGVLPVYRLGTVTMPIKRR